ncbi:hypothetical protein [Bacillus thuringiensis]|nr:hypothetical protein [Bacillus thuringiensis]
MTMSGAMAATMMTVGSTNAWAEPITVKDIPSQFGAQQSSQTNPKFIGFIADVADAVLSTGSQVRAAATHVAGDQWDRDGCWTSLGCTECYEYGS